MGQQGPPDKSSNENAARDSEEQESYRHRLLAEYRQKKETSEKGEKTDKKKKKTRKKKN